MDLWSTLEKTIILITHDVDEAVLMSDRVYVLSQRPARVRMVVDVGLSRPRTYQSITQETFIGLKAQLLAALWEEASPAWVSQEALP